VNNIVRLIVDSLNAMIYSFYTQKNWYFVLQATNFSISCWIQVCESIL